jgi:preprotein translocase subunit SecY
MTGILLRALTLENLRKKILVTLIVLAFYRLLAHIPVPNINHEALGVLFNSSSFFSILNLFSGGGLSNMSLVAVGLSPYISASIILQLLTLLVPSLEQLSKEGSIGRQRINQYIQMLTFPIAFAQAYGIYALLTRQDIGGQQIFINNNWFSILLIVTIIVAGTYLLMFLGELISQYGVGQGISMLIFAGIVSGIPSSVGQFALTLENIQIFTVLTFSVMALAVIAGVVYITQAFRKIEIQYSGRAKPGATSMAGAKSYIPIKVNQAGVIPIIFAVSLVVVPNVLGSYLQRLDNRTLSDIGLWLTINFSSTSILYTVFYFLMVFAFTYLYTSITFNPEKISEDIRRNGGFIPGIRPGGSTVAHLRYIINRLTLAGGVFLGLIAVLPSITQSLTGITALSIGGTGILIVVSVILETIKQVEAQVISKEYDSINN